MSKLIEAMADLYSYFGSDPTYASLCRRIYKDTACGASISLYGTVKRKPFAVHNGDDEPPKGFIPTGFTIQTIVEGSDAEVNSDLFTFGKVTEAELDAWIKDMEAGAEALWDEANESE